MAEKIRTNQEHYHTPEAPSHSPEHGHHESVHHHKENLEHIRREAREQAQNAHEVAVERPDKAHKPVEHYINSELKDLSYARTMTRVRKQLSPVSRTFSKVIHNPVVDAASEGVAKTVGRPSGIIGGGLLALAGTTAYYYIAKHYGYEYNFGVFLCLLGAGFIIGWIAELVLKTLRPSR